MKGLQMKTKIALLCLSVLATVAQAQPDLKNYEGWVITVLSGDTIRVLDGSNRMTKIRLRSIDAPQRGQAFDDESRKHLASLLSGKEVKVETKGEDGFGSILATIWVEPKNCSTCKKTLDANLAQVQAGMAWWYKAFAKKQSSSDRESYESGESQAKRQKLGLWAESDPEPPWEWRERTGEHEN
jgi:endonuclease YncB( thermonuclease family)